MQAGQRLLLIVSGGIAAYKAPELIRRLKERGIDVTVVTTKGAEQFVTPLTLAAVSENKVYRDLFSLTDESEMGHIELSRAADLLLVAPASADLLAKMAHGLADDLASTVLLATDKAVMAAPAMNVRMWEHPATQANLALLKARGVATVGPNEGPMACGEFGFGRMAEPMEIVAAVTQRLALGQSLKGRHVLVTSGPTHEAIDPVRYIANRSSGKQGHAIAAAAAREGARVTLVTGPVQIADPPGVAVEHIESADQMLAACHAALPADVAVFAAAVADWKVAEAAPQKLKKEAGAAPSLSFALNPDILASVAQLAAGRRPALVVGFAAETQDVVAYATKKRQAKGCDWIVANDVSAAGQVFGGEENAVHVIDAAGCETWPRASKQAVAGKLIERIARHLAGMGAPA